MRRGLPLLLILAAMPMLAQTHVFRPTRVVPPFPPITDAPVSTAAQTRIRPDELVLGVEINGEARAYPINMLTGPRREIINDSVGGRSIAATW